MKIIPFIMAILISLVGRTQTSVPGGVVTGDWLLAGSPYLVQGSIMIPDGATLSIEPGTSIIFQGHFKLVVSGRLLAVGTMNDSITFTAANMDEGWYGLRFDNTTTSNDTSRVVFSNILWGRAQGSGNDGMGGGVFMQDFSKVVIDQCSLLNNTANSGGAIACLSSHPRISGNIISDNTANYGGGILCNASSPFIHQNTIRNNASTSGGAGGVQCVLISNPSIVHNTFSDNSTNGGGGAIFCSNSSPTIQGNTFIGNTANINGGAILADNGCNSIISDNVIVYNSCAQGSGGGVTANFGNPTIFNNLISNNSAPFGGGIGSSLNDGPYIHDNVICNNTATDLLSGGGGVFFNSSSPLFVNNTVVYNASAGNGGGVHCRGSAAPVFRNCILSNNTAAGDGLQVHLRDETSDPDFHHCLVEGGSAGFGLNGNFYTGTYLNNLVSDPQFIAPSANSGADTDGVDQDWTLFASSPCIDAGDPAGNYPATDIAGALRIFGSAIDIGAYEYQGTSNVPGHRSDEQPTVYPNPFTHRTMIRSAQTIYNGELTIYDTNGRIVRSLSIVNSNFISVERGDLECGAYSFDLLVGRRTGLKGKLMIIDY